MSRTRRQDTRPAALQPLSAAAKLRLVAEILGTYALVRWRMRDSDIRVVVGHTRRGGSAERHSDRPVALRLARAVGRTLRVLPADDRCLARSLVLDALLARRGLESVLVIAARAEPAFAAHAWVEHDGIPVLPAGAAGYERLVSL